MSLTDCAVVDQVRGQVPQEHRAEFEELLAVRFVLKMMNFALKMMNFVLKMMNFALKMVNFVSRELL